MPSQGRFDGMLGDPLLGAHDPEIGDLPWPFADFLLYCELETVPGHRDLYAYDSLLARRHPRKAAPWF